MADVAILVCACGMRLKAAGAVPGRVGKCPSCGGMLRVPDPGPVLPAAAPAAEWPDTYSSRRTRRASSARRCDPLRIIRSGLVRPPARAETRLGQSLLYPAWGATSLALLLFMPPLLGFASIPPISLALGWASGNAGLWAPGLAGLLPATFVLVPAGSFTLLYLGRVLATSAAGDVHPPRWPDWEAHEAIREIGRWAWALLVGGFAGGFPSVAYWMYCGDIDAVDTVILVQLGAFGALYAEVALLASILHEDALGANPITVLRALRRVGLGWVPPALLIASFAYLAMIALMRVIAIGNPLLAVLAFWAYWVFLLYGAMVVLRVLGLCYHRHARVLGWFRERPRWGG